MPTCSGSTPLTPWTPQTQVLHAALAPRHLATQRKLNLRRRTPRSFSPTSGSATLAPPSMDRQRQRQLRRQHHPQRHRQFPHQVVAPGLNLIRFRSVETALHTAWPTLTIASSVTVTGFTRTRQLRRQHPPQRRPHLPAHQVAQVVR